MACCPEPADLRFTEQIVAGEHLVGALAGQHDLDAGIADEPRQQEHRRRRGAQDRPFGMEDGLGKHARDVVARDEDLAVIAPQIRRHRPLMPGLVVLGVVEPQREGGELGSLGAQTERGDERAVEAAGEVAADLHVGAQHAQAGGVLEAVTDALDRFVERAGEAGRVGRGIVRAPAAAGADDPAAGVSARGARLELLDALEDRARRERRPEREELIEAGGVEPARQRSIQGEERLDLAREQQPPVVRGDVEGTHAERIAGQCQRSRRRVPQRERPLAVEAAERLVAPLLVGMDDDLGITLRVEAVAVRAQLLAHLDVVEDLAVEDDPDRPVLVGERLLPGAQIDDRQARVPERGALIAVHPEFVGAAMAERADHGRQPVEIDRRQAIAERNGAGDAAHYARISDTFSTSSGRACR
jgi:hypothetical protein